MTHHRSSDPTIGSGAFGTWMTDREGLPAYEYTCDQTTEARAESFHTSGKRQHEHWHLAGNLRWNVLVYNHGGIQVYESDRGPQFLLQGNQGFGIVEIQLENGQTWSDAWPGPEHFRRIFGMGYFRKIVESDGLRVDHRLMVPPGDVRGLVSEVVVQNLSPGAIEFTVSEPWHPRVRPITAAMVATGRGRREFGSGWLAQLGGTFLNLARTVARSHPDLARDRLERRYAYHFIEDPATGSPGFELECIDPPGHHRDDPAPWDEYPDPLFLVRCSGPPPEVIRDNLENRIVLSRRVRLESGGSRRWTTGFVRGKPDRFLRELGPVDQLMKVTAMSHRQKRIRLETEKDPWLARETQWHSYYLRAGATREEFFRSTTLNQGSAYGYLQGMNGAARDLCLAAHPLIYADPALARSVLGYVMRMTTEDGKLWYAVTGHGYLTDAIIHHSPSELYLHLLWVLSEYLFATRDFSFLEARLPFHPPGGAGESTVMKRIEMACLYQLDRIGRGPRGLVRVGSGDWNDPISFMARSRRAFFHDGESAFNTAMAMYVYPRIASILRGRNDALAKRLELEGEKLLAALEATWNGRWYPRAFDGKGGAIGDDRLFLEHHAWILAGARVAEDRRQALVDAIAGRLDTPSPIGAVLLYPPVKVRYDALKPGWDTNGGVWAAINSLLSWGYARHDLELAYRSLVRNTLCTHAEVYPDCWYGIWSGPDAYNAYHAERPGETFYHFATPMTDFPVMNSNCHAGPLAASVRLAGIDNESDGLVVDPRITGQSYTLDSPLITLAVTPDEIRLRYSPIGRDRYSLRVRIPEGWDPATVSADVRGRNASPRWSGRWCIWPKELYSRADVLLKRGS